MTVNFRNGCIAAAAAALFPQTLVADIGAADIWQSQQDYLAALGADMTGQVTRSGVVETVSGITATFTLPFDAGTLVLTGPDMILTELDQGTVSLSYAQPVIVGLAADITGHGSISARLALGLDNPDIIASGRPGDITYDYSIDRMTFELLDLTAGGALEGTTVALTGNIAELSGQSRAQTADLVTLTSGYAMGALDLNYAMTDPDGTRVTGTGGSDSTTGSSEIVLPRDGMDIMNLAAALSRGLRFSATSETVGYSTSETTETDGQVIAAQMTSSAVQTVRYGLDESGLTMEGKAHDNKVEFANQLLLPVPVSASIVTAEGVMQLPVSAGPQPQDMRMQMVMDGVTINEALWSALDPAQILPRDAATVELDLTGQIRNFVDWLNFAQVQTVIEGGGMPAEPVALTLNRLNVSMAGTDLNGSGAISFDNQDLDSYGGLPKPVGAVDLSLRGANTLIDRLVEMGLVQAEDANGARMMMAIMARPDPDGGDDALMSRIELTGDGQILANGQRLK